MMKRIFSLALDRFQKRYQYDVSYGRYVLEHSERAFLKLTRLQGFGSYREDVPRDVYYAAKITSSIRADCGSCTQLVVTWAEEAGVSPALIRAIVSGDPKLPADVALAVRFTDAVLSRDPACDLMRAEIRKNWGDKAVISLAFAIAAGQLYPNLKYGLGFGHECSLVQVAGSPVKVEHQAKQEMMAR
jgi:hypothetical protein